MSNVHAIKNRAAEFFEIHGTVAPTPQFGEEPMKYRQRLLSCAQSMLPPDHDWAAVPLSRQPERALDAAERVIYDDTVRQYKAPVGDERSWVERDRTGREIMHFAGDPEVIWGRFKMQPLRVCGFTDEGRGAKSVEYRAAVAKHNYEMGLAFQALAEKRAAGR
jgi:hypothetical protein